MYWYLSQYIWESQSGPSSAGNYKFFPHPPTDGPTGGTGGPGRTDGRVWTGGRADGRTATDRPAAGMILNESTTISIDFETILNDSTTIFIHFE